MARSRTALFAFADAATDRRDAAWRGVASFYIYDARMMNPSSADGRRSFFARCWHRAAPIIIATQGCQTFYQFPTQHIQSHHSSFLKIPIHSFLMILYIVN